MKDPRAYWVSSDDVRYAYAVGRIRALETTLLGKQRLERMAEARDLEDALRQLSDTVYGAHLDEIEEGGYETLLKDEEERLLRLVDSLSLDRDISAMLRMKYDFHNLKVAIREKVSERNLSHLYVDFGVFDPAVVRAALMAEGMNLVPEPLLDAATRGLEAYSKTHDPGQVDLAIDRVMFAQFLSLVEGRGNLYIEAIVRTWIDLANVRTFMRSRYLGVDSRALPGLLIEGGFAGLSDFHEAFPQPLDEVLQRFELSPYRHIIDRGGVGLERRESFVPLEREIDSYMVFLLRASRYFTFGLEIVLAYGLLKQNEIRALRLILAGKDRGLPTESIKERIPDAD